MADNNNTLLLLIKSLFDSSGSDQAKAKLQELKDLASDGGKSFATLSTIGAGVGGALATGLAAAYGVLKDLTEQEMKFGQEILKSSDRLSEQEQNWFRLAENAHSFTDAARLGLQTISAVAEAQQKATDAARAAQLGPDSLVKQTLEFLAKVGSWGSVVGPWTQQLRDQAETFRVLAENARTAAVAVQLFAQNEASSFAALQNMPLEQQRLEILKQIRDLSFQRAILNPRADQDQLTQWTQLNAAIAARGDLLGQVLNKQQQQKDLLKETQDQIRLNNDAGNEEAQIQDRVTEAYDKKLKALKDAKVPEERAKQIAQEHAESVRQAAEVKAGTDTSADTSVQERLTELMREQATILQGIHQQQQLIQASPFLGADERQNLLLDSYNRELQQLQQHISQLNTLKSTGLLNPSELAQVNQRLQQANFEVQLLGQHISALKAPLTTELVNWANNFGTTWQQVGRSMEQAIDGALDSLNEGLVTGQFNTQQLIQSLEKIGLQLLEHIAIQQIMHAISQAAMTENQVQGVATAAAWAPAAAATSVGSFGTSAVVGEAAAIAAIFAIMGALVAHEGGELGRGRLRKMHSGGLAHDEVPIIAQENEIMIRKGIAQPFSHFLLALNSGDPSAMMLASMFHGGGVIPPFIAGRRYHGGSDDNPGMTILGVPLGMVEGPSDINPPDISQVSEPHQNIEFTSMVGDAPGKYVSAMTSIFGYNPAFFGYAAGWGPGSLQGPTIDPTFFDPGGYPFAIPVNDPTNLTTQWQPTQNEQMFKGNPIATRHSGGWIGRGAPSISRMHIGGLTRRIPRLHSGGVASGSGGGSRQMGANALNIYAFTDLKELSRHMASRQGQKIIFDTINGRRIDLGFRK